MTRRRFAAHGVLVLLLVAAQAWSPMRALAQRGVSPSPGASAGARAGATVRLGASGHAVAPAGSIRFTGAIAPGQRSLFPPPGITSTREVYYDNGIRRYAPGNVGGRGRSGYGGGLGFLDLGYGYPAAGVGLGGAVGVADPGFFYADSNAYDPLDPNNTPAYRPAAVATAQDAFPGAQVGPYAAAVQTSTPYAASYPGYAAAPNAGAPYPEASEAPATRPAYRVLPAGSEQAQPPSEPRPAARPLAEEEPVTIVFKDGRPNEQVRNYALTRTTLLIPGAKVRSIPVDQIDLPATQKVNADAGLDFEIPAGR